MISVFCKQCRDDKYYGVKLTFNKSDLLSLVTIDNSEGISYGFILRSWVGYWMYVDKLDYDMVIEVLKLKDYKRI